MLIATTAWEHLKGVVNGDTCGSFVSIVFAFGIIIPYC